MPGASTVAYFGECSRCGSELLDEEGIDHLNGDLCCADCREEA